MSIKYHPKQGTILICDFGKCFTPPEMVKRRLVVVVSPKFKRRSGLCTVVPLSTTPPEPEMPYHYKLEWEEPFPKPFNKKNYAWVKGDMLATVSFERLSIPKKGRDSNGKRIYDKRTVTQEQLTEIRKCILNGLGLKTLTNYL